MQVINLDEKFHAFAEHYVPRLVARVQDCEVKLAKLLGEFEWHHHEAEDELFFVVRGRLLIKFRDRDLWLDPGEMVVIPRGVDHLPVAPEEVWVMLVEPVGTRNTGHRVTDRTVDRPEPL